MNRRLPAEWEAQDGVLLAWPHPETDWHPYLDRVEPVFIEIIRQISRFERVLIAAPDSCELAAKLREADINTTKVRIYELPTNDTWTRDFGPITVIEDGKPRLLDCGFNGWGLKFPSHFDNQATCALHKAGAFGATPKEVVGLILEGGSIESDGAGTILTTAECLLNVNRNPHMERDQIEEQLKNLLGAKHILWLENGYLAGDDTDSHIDTLARLCPNDTIAYVVCDDLYDEHHAALKRMEAELKKLRTQDGRPYRLIPLPWPSPSFDEEGDRMPATYANFLIINGAVLVPTYNDPNDQNALEAIGQAFPEHAIIGIDCSPLILQHGSLHCVTLQIPEGVLA